MSSVEPTEAVSVERVEGTKASTSRSEVSRRRRRLSADEALEIARLYADTSTPTSEIRERFGIGDSSLYRIVQRLGVGVRRPTAPRAPRSVNGRSAGTTLRRTPVTARTSASSGTVSRRTSDSRQQFRIVFVAERVVRATDMRDAIRQAEALGATEITAVSRQD